MHRSFLRSRQAGALSPLRSYYCCLALSHISAFSLQILFFRPFQPISKLFPTSLSSYSSSYFFVFSKLSLSAFSKFYFPALLLQREFAYD